MCTPLSSVIFASTAVLVMSIAASATAGETQSVIANDPAVSAPVITASPVAKQIVVADAAAAAQVGVESHEAPAVPAPPSGDGITVSFSANVSSGRIFQEQQFVLTRHPVTEVDFTVSFDNGWYVDLWHAESLAGRFKDRETDLDVGKDTKLGAYTLRLDVGYFEFAGPDEWRGRIKLSRPVSDHCGVDAYVDVMRGQLDTEVVRAGLVCTSKHWSVDMGPAYDHAFNALGVEYTVGWKLFADKPIRVFVKGFVGNRGEEAIVGMDIFHKTW